MTTSCLTSRHRHLSFTLRDTTSSWQVCPQLLSHKYRYNPPKSHLQFLCFILTKPKHLHRLSTKSTKLIPKLSRQLLTPNIKMQLFTLTTLTALLAAVAYAAPKAEPRQFQAQITFEGAAGAEFSMSVPTDASVFAISMSLSLYRFSLAAF